MDAETLVPGATLRKAMEANLSPAGWRLFAYYLASTKQGEALEMNGLQLALVVGVAVQKLPPIRRRLLDANLLEPAGRDGQTVFYRVPPQLMHSPSGESAPSDRGPAAASAGPAELVKAA